NNTLRTGLGWNRTAVTAAWSGHAGGSTCSHGTTALAGSFALRRRTYPRRRNESQPETPEAAGRAAAMGTRKAAPAVRRGRPTARRRQPLALRWLRGTPDSFGLMPKKSFHLIRFRH